LLFPSHPHSLPSHSIRALSLLILYLTLCLCLDLFLKVVGLKQGEPGGEGSAQL
jgi:hypothetical protein